MKYSRKTFSQAELERLKKNKYTFYATVKSLYFTKEFKELFIREYSEGKKPRQILEECGYSAEVLGDNRIQGISHMIRRQALSVVGLHEGTFRPGSGVSGCLQDPSVDPVAECRRLRSEIEYLKQEVEFLKKISSIRTSNDCRA